MRILLIGINFAPEMIGVGKYTGEMAAWFAARGHDVTVVTAHPYYPDCPARGFERWRWGQETWQGCRVVRCPFYVPARWSGARRTVHLASFAFSSGVAAAVAAMGGRAEIIAAVAPTLLSAPHALALARLTGGKAWLHYQDFEIEAGRELALLSRGRMVEAALAVERTLLRRFDLVSSISPRMVEALERKGAPPGRLMLFPNWVDTERFRPLGAAPALRRELGIAEGRPIVVYSGNMGRKQGLEVVIEAARTLGTRDAAPLFVLAGAGAMRAELERAAGGLSNVRLMPLVSEERFNEFLNLGDIHLLPQRGGIADLVMPSKLGAMLATGRAVIAMAAPGTQVARMLEGVGVVVPPEDPAALAAAIAALAADPARRTALGAAAREAACRLMRDDVILGAAERRLLQLVSGPAHESQDRAAARLQ